MTMNYDYNDDDNNDDVDGDDCYQNWLQNFVDARSYMIVRAEMKYINI